MRPSFFAAPLVALVACSTPADAPAPTGVVPHYVAISAALAADSAEIGTDAAELARLAGTMASEPGMPAVATAAAQLGQGDIEAQRIAFKRVSDGMIEYMRAKPDTQTGNVIVFCPMAFEDKGALWVQAAGKIANPYFGAKMLRCGDKLAWDAELPETAKL